MVETSTPVGGGVLSARNPILQQNMVTMVGGRSTVINEKSGGGAAVSKKLKKNIIKQEDEHTKARIFLDTISKS